MKIKHLLMNSFLGLTLFSSFTAYAQEPKKVQPCNTFAAMEERFANDPAAKERYEKIQAQLLKEYLDNEDKRMANKMAAPPIYTVPVVFHVLHTGGSENISDATCISALNYVNLDFARMNTDANTTDPLFNASYINSEIVFMLAKKDPSGNCTNGIVHHIDTRTDWSQSQTLTNYAYTWDPTKYLNIYVVKQIIPTSTVSGGGIIVGYTYKPGTWPTNAPQDAIVYRHDYLTGGDNPRSLTHEIGHWLNLAHTWGNTNDPGQACGDDNIGDTPETMGEFSSCPSSSVNSCVQTNTVYNNTRNVNNIMNYSSCPKNFTTGQTNAMRTALAAAASGRNNLWTAGNLVFTDVNGTAPCAPIADFMSTATGDYTICSGQTLVQMKDYSYNATTTSWIWSATNNATISAPTSSVTNIYFPTPGLSVITLSVSNANGGSSKTRTVTVIDAAVTATNGITESFEAGGVPPNWSVINQSGVQWANSGLGASHGTRSFLIDGTISSGGQQDILMMPIMNFAAYPTQSLTFSYAYRRKSTTHNDIFKVQLSNDCGGSWKDVFAPSPAVMATGSGGVGTTPYVPAITEWKKVDVTGHPNYFQFTASSAVMARFFFEEGAGGFGNRLFLDSINLVAAVVDIGVNELTRHLDLNMSPNPTKSSANINFVLSNDATIKIAVMDITGKAVIPQVVYNLNSGTHNLVVNENGILTKGIYIVNIDYNGTRMARKLIIE